MVAVGAVQVPARPVTAFPSRFHIAEEFIRKYERKGEVGGRDGPALQRTGGGKLGSERNRGTGVLSRSKSMAGDVRPDTLFEPGVFHAAMKQPRLSHRERVVFARAAFESVHGLNPGVHQVPAIEIQESAFHGTKRICARMAKLTEQRAGSTQKRQGAAAELLNARSGRAIRFAVVPFRMGTAAKLRGGIDASGKPSCREALCVRQRCERARPIGAGSGVILEQIDGPSQKIERFLIASFFNRREPQRSLYSPVPQPVLRFPHNRFRFAQ
jgi:hypothetical protein